MKIVQDNLLKVKHAIKVHVQFGLIGQTGVNVRSTVKVVANQEPVNVSMVRNGIAQDPLPTNNNAIDSPVLSLEK